MLPNCQNISTSSENDLRRIIVDSNDSRSLSLSTIYLPELKLSDSDLNWKLDNLCPKDLNIVKQICINSFPLVYPETWYEEVVTGKFIAFGVYHGDLLTSLLVAEIKRIADCDKEDRDLDNDPETLVCYILSLAVSSEYRRKGIGCILINHLLKTYVNATPYPKLVFLHVLHSNYAAINFYKQFGFEHYSTLLNYYVINDIYEAGCTYVLRTGKKTTQNTIKGFFSYILATICKPFRSILRRGTFNNGTF